MVPARAYEPFGSVSFAGAQWPIPAQPAHFLSFLYG
jgi:hypothetical protein